MAKKKIATKPAGRAARKRRALRSHAWFGLADRDGMAHRSWMKNRGMPADQFDGRPVIGICNTWSEFNPCNAHFRDIAERVKRGVYEAGGVPMEFPVFSNSESQNRPTAMLYRWTVWYCWLAVTRPRRR